MGEIIMTSTTHHRGMLIPECHRTLDRILKAGVDRVILHGPPGTGKTYSALTLELGGRPSYRLVCTEDMTTADVAGMYMPNAEGSFTWHDGVATKAWRTGGRLVIDEIDKAGGDVFALLLAYTDSVGSASLDLLNGETIRPAPGFSAVMTTNIEDPNDLPPALRDRFPIAICIDSAHPMALDFAYDELRVIFAEIVADKKKSRRASLRACMSFQHLISKGFTIVEAGNLVFGAAITETIVDTLKVATVGSRSEVMSMDARSAAAPIHVEVVSEAVATTIAGTVLPASAFVTGSGGGMPSSAVAYSDFESFEE